MSEKANHIILNNEVIIDLREDTVTAGTLKKGITAHDKSGTIIQGTLEDPKFQEKVVTANGSITPDAGYDGLSKVEVNVPIPEGYVKPTGDLKVNSNGTFDVVNKATVTVDIDIPVIPEDYDGLVIITRQEPEEEPLDPTFNHYSVIPEWAVLGYTDANDDWIELTGGEPFPTDKSVYANGAEYDDGGTVRYRCDDGKEWRYIETIQASEDSTPTQVLASIDGIPVTTIESTAGQVGPPLVALELPTSITKIIDVSPLFGNSELTSIIYLGTKEQWNTVELVDGWNRKCSAEITVTCTDGTITIPAYES